MGASLGHKLVGRVFAPGWFFPHEVAFKARAQETDAENSPLPTFEVARIADPVKCNVREANLKEVSDFYRQDVVMSHVLATKTDVSALLPGDRAEYTDPVRGERFFEVVGTKDYVNQQAVWHVYCMELRANEVRP